MKKMKQKKIIFSLIITIFFIISTTIFVYKYVKNESPIYIFDYSGYHEIYKIFSKELIETPVKYIRDVISSIRNSDYNCSPILLLIPFYLVFNTSRIGYILGSCLLYVVPSIILSIILTKKMILKNDEQNENNKIILTLFICIVSFLYTRWWSPTLRGLPDIIAVIPLAIAGILSLKFSFIEKQKIYVPVIIGFLMYLCFLFRRYFIYAIIGFYVALFIKELIRFIKVKEDKKEKLLNGLKNFFIAGCTTLIMVLIIQFPLVKSIISQNYSESYSAFQDSLQNHLYRTINEFGYIILFFSICGSIYTLKNKKHRENGIFCLVNIFVCYGTFMTVQAMGVHHYLTISLWIFVLFVYGVYAIWKLIKLKSLKIIWLLTIIVIMAINFASTYIFRNLKLNIITQNNKYCKFYYENFDELERLIKDIDAFIINQNAKFSVLASSEILSDNLLDLLGTEKMKSSIVYTSAIDLRDGVNFNSLMSKYIVVTNIAQTGTSAEGQRIISVPNNAIINDNSIGKAYKKISGPYFLEGNVNAYIYEKTRAFTQEEVNDYMETLIQYYPEWKEQYTQFDYAVLMGESELGEETGNVSRYKYDCIYISPGYTPTKYAIKLNKKIKSLSLNLKIDENGVDTNTVDYGKIKLTVLKDDEIIYENNVLYNQPQDILLDVSNADTMQFIVDKDGLLSWDNLYITLNNVVCIE